MLEFFAAPHPDPLPASGGRGREAPRRVAWLGFTADGPGPGAMNRKQRRAAQKHERSASVGAGDPRLARELGSAAEHLRAGKPAEAAAALRRVLAIEPHHAKALHHL